MVLSLPSVTVCCIDTRFPELAEYSLHRSIETAQVEFGEVLLFTSEARARFERRYAFPLTVIGIGEIGSKVDYSRFVIRELPGYLKTDQALLTQWDSFVLDAAAWRPEFLDFDYLGALWHWMQGTARVGNGGFSLRSKRLMHAARESIDQVDDNEDVLICIKHREDLEQRFGVRFADEATATRFAFERAAPDGPTFGFHGLFNFDRTMAPDELDAYAQGLPPALALTVEGAELAARVFNAGRRELGRSLVRRRLATEPDDRVGRSLAAQMWKAHEPCWCGSGQPTGTCHPPQVAVTGESTRGATSPKAQTPAHDGYNADVLTMIPVNLPRVVEVGASSGALAQAYRRSNPETDYVGIEVDPEYAERCKSRCSRVLHANIEQMSDDQLQALLPVDCWVFADVLEHLYDPWRVLKRLRETMRPGDCVVACLPNTQHWSILARLVSGNLWYEDMGLMDRTHIRFFTRITLVKMFQDSGFRIESGRPRILNFEHQDRALAAVRSFAQALGLDPEVSARDAIVFQHVVRAVPA